MITLRKMSAGHLTRMGEMRNAYKILVRRYQGKSPLRRPTRRYEDNVEMNLRGTECKDVKWIKLAENRFQWRGFFF